MEPLTRLYEREDLSSFPLPPGLSERYGGPIGFSVPRLISNFVSSIDGVVAVPSVENAGSFISRKSEQDRFVMGLLRACAGAVLIGAETLRAEPDHRWIPQHVFPDAADEFADLRRRLGLGAQPELAVVTSTGDLDPSTPALEGALILTGAKGAREVARRRIPAADVLELPNGRQVSPVAVVEALRTRRYDLILSEAGPSLTAQLTRERLLDELFLTVSPVIVGRNGGETRAGLAQGVDLLRPDPVSATLLSASRGGSHLFLRYALDSGLDVATQQEKRE